MRHHTVEAYKPDLEQHNRNQTFAIQLTEQAGTALCFHRRQYNKYKGKIAETAELNNQVTIITQRARTG